MRIKSVAASVAFKLLLILAGIAGLLLVFGVFDGEFAASSLNYFTVLSNLLCVLYMAADVVYILKHRYDTDKDVLLPALKGVVMMALTVTFLVAHFVLGMRFTMGSSSGVSLLLVHYVVPLMMIADWLLFDRKGLIRAFSPLVWTIFPFLYFVYAIIAARIGDGIGYNSRYPYPFIDADTLGWGTVLRNVLVLVVFFVALGYVYFAIDKGLFKAGQAGKKAKLMNT